MLTNNTRIKGNFLGLVSVYAHMSSAFNVNSCFILRADPVICIHCPPPTYRGWAGIMIFTFQSPGINSALWGQAEGPQGFWGSGENGYLLSGSKLSGEQTHSFGDLGSPAKNNKKNLTLKEKPSFLLIFQKNSSASGGKPPTPPFHI